MKKTLVAMAALAVVGAASAQSSVTLYGRIDASVSQVNTKVGGVKVLDLGTEIASGRHTGSRFGMRGSEDLGGGLKANFQIENGFNVDTGAAAQLGLLFGRQAWVGLSGGFGSFTAGRQYSPFDTLMGTLDMQGYSGYSAMGFAWNRGTLLDLGRINNSVQYTTPNMGGFSAGLMWAPGENGVAGGVNAGNFTSPFVNYSAGPLNVMAVYETVKATSATPANVTTSVGLSYDLGVAKVSFAIDQQKNKATTAKDSGWLLGASMPLGSMSLAVGFAKEKTKLAGVTTSNNTGFGANLNYPLSKRTYVYGAFLRGRDSIPNLRTQMWGLGLVHNF